MGVLIVYYSLTGNSKKVAETLVKILACNLVEIKDTSSRKGIIGFLKSGYEALTKKVVPIDEINIDFSSFDHVIVVCPIWAGNLPSPVRSFLKKYLSSIRKISFVFTHASGKNVNISKVFEKDFDKKASNCISICASNVRCDSFEDKLKEFAKKIEM